jgi:PHP family Zn ribbon phosphoesterase
MVKKNSRETAQWRTMDLHIHTPASTDFQQMEVTFMEILQKAESRGLEILSITDHNTIAGYRKLLEEISQLELLETLNRLTLDEKSKLTEYRRLFKKMLILPGFEFTAALGFHILAIFPPDKPIREIEHLLLSLGIPPDQLDIGSQTVGATTDALTAYKQINQAGGLVIAAHANSSNGVAMRGLNFGGQTRIAYTQDPNLHALEVTDLEQKNGRTTAAFFNGTKPEYPRRMHCIQGSDSHRLTADSARKKVLGVGDRATDVLITDLTFDALKELFIGNDFSRTRPHRHEEEPAYDFLQAALEEGSNIVQEFHESMTIKGGKLYAILSDVCAFANTNGGTLFIGLPNDPHKPIEGIQDAEQAIGPLEKEISTRISPPLPLTIDVLEWKSKKIIRILVPRGNDAPYALDDYKIYVRDESETNLAVRDEVVGLVTRGLQRMSATSEQQSELPVTTTPVAEPKPTKPEDNSPRTGVEVLKPEERGGKLYFTVRDLRNGNIVKNITKASARRLWHYAITEYEELTSNPDQTFLQWHGDYGLIKKHKQDKTFYYDLIQRIPEGYRYYYGVTIDGIHGPWKYFTGEEE